jgi:sulfur-oxidizing protein SoxA
MGSAGAALATITAFALSVGAVQADPNDNQLVIEGETIPTEAKAPEGSPFDKLYSGWRYRSPETQALQMDDFENPGFPLVDRGQALWSTVDGSAGKSCASCHNDASESMKGVRAGMPKWHNEIGKVQSLEHHINYCRTERMGAKAWKWESDDMLGMTAYVGLQSRGMPTHVKTDGKNKDFYEKGKKLYYTRFGQLDMACAGCHEDNTGRMIRADHLSQGQINGFPLYRFKWSKMGSIHRRFKGCMDNIRAEPYKRGSDEFTALELYVASRGQGLRVETPAVRQ